MRLVPADQPRVTTAAAAVAAAESKLAFPKRTCLTGSRTGGGGGADRKWRAVPAPPDPEEPAVTRRIGCQISGRFRGVTEQRLP